MHDHIHVHAGIGERPEYRGRDSRLIRDPQQRDFRFVARIGDAGDRIFFHDIFLVANKRTSAIRVKSGQHSNRYAMHHGQLHRSRLQNLRTQ